MITAAEFTDAMAQFAPFEPRPVIAVGVSGGGDSMALLCLLRDWAAARQGTVIALTVDHGLRPAAAREARQVKHWCRALGVAHHTLRWQGDKPASGILEAARAARYDLLQNWCRKKNILHLAVAHHADDQLETLLLRFSKGSGVGGLSGIQPVHYLNHVRLLRPLLPWPKSALLATCEHLGQDWLEDPSNHNAAYARPRLRDMLAREGLTHAAAQLLAARMQLAEAALQQQTIALLAHSARLIPAQRAELPLSAWQQWPVELQLRSLKRMLQTVNPAARHIRHARLLALQDSLTQPAFRGRTLVGCKINAKQQILTVILE